MTSRSRILGGIRKSLSASQHDALTRKERLSAARRRIARPVRGIIPARLSEPHYSLVSAFCAKVVESKASVKKVKSYGKAGAAIVEYLRQHHLPQIVRMGSDRRLKKSNLQKSGLIDVLIGPSEGSDLVCISHAIGGISETGTLVLGSGLDNPSTLNFLPETHIILVNKNDIRNNYEGAWKILRRKYGKGKMPRTINLITGPSSSADIEQTFILGAHGPLRVHVIVVDEGG